MIYDIFGWFGMVTMLLAYFLLSANIIKNGILYQLLKSEENKDENSLFFCYNYFSKDD